MAEGKSLSKAALKSVFTMCAMGPLSTYLIIPYGLGGGGEKTEELKCASSWRISADMTADASS